MDEVTYAVSKKEKPIFSHAAILALLSLSLAIFLSSNYAWDLTAQTTYQILRITGINAHYIRSSWLIKVRLPDGTFAGFQVLTEFSSLLTVIIFAVISTFTVGLLKGLLLTKVGWFLLSIGVGVLWNINRLILVIAVAYNFGLAASSFIHYLVGPAIDFIWVVSMWALGMSWLKKGGRYL